MASYFVATDAPGGAHAVHDRSRCPPAAFPRDAAEYLGEFLDPAQAIAVARLRYVHVSACTCLRQRVATEQDLPALSSLRS